MQIFNKMKKLIQIRGVSENLDSHMKGVPYFVEGFGTVFIRRGGQKGWREAIRDATEEVLGMDNNSNFISFEHEQAIEMKACSSYLVAKLGDDCVDYDGNPIPNSLSNIKSIFENPQNYQLVRDLINASQQGERFLMEVVEQEIEHLKKS